MSSSSSSSSTEPSEKKLKIEDEDTFDFTAQLPGKKITPEQLARYNNFNFVKSVVDQCMPAVVHIRTNTSTSSGFIIGMSKTSFFVITNFHCVEGANFIFATLNDERLYIDGKVILPNATIDLALVRFRFKASDGTKPIVPVLYLTDKEPNTGEFVVVLGSPVGLRKTALFGIIANNKGSGKYLIKGHQHTRDYLMLNMQAYPGNSGGPVLNLKGEVVGIITITGILHERERLGSVGFAIPISERFFEKLLNNTVTYRPYTGFLLRYATYEQVKPYLAYSERFSRIFLKEPETKLRVTEVETKSPSEDKLFPGDIILSLDGVTDGNKIFDMIGNVQEKQELKFVIGRTINKTVKEVNVTITVSRVVSMAYYEPSVISIDRCLKCGGNKKLLNN